jgi:hypothetical protein
MKALALLVSAAAIAGASADISRERAQAFERKLAQIIRNGEVSLAGNGPERRTTVTQDEVNSYLRFSAGDQIPVGVTDPQITVLGGGRLSGRAVVDLDAVRKARSSGGWLDPWSYLTGRVPLTAEGVLHTHEGRGRFVLEQAAVAGVPIPKTVLQEIVSYYSRRPELPEGIDLDAPFELPVGIRRIEIHEKSVTIVQ